MNKITNFAKKIRNNNQRNYTSSMNTDLAASAILTFIMVGIISAGLYWASTTDFKFSDINIPYISIQIGK